MSDINTRTDYPVCEKVFKTNNGLRAHFAGKHPNDPFPFKMSWYENSQKAGQKKKEQRMKEKQNEFQT